jgi:2-keto-3-deoxy-L-rhamnonate aldolase RhmA
VRPRHKGVRTWIQLLKRRSRRAASLRTLRNGAAAVGTFVGLGSIPATEICARAGFEWLLIDLEHGAGGESVLNAQIHTAARFGALSLVRVSTPDRIHCSRALDLGADGIMAPRLDTPEDVADFVRHLHYPPEGDRGVATYHSAAGYGLVNNYFENVLEPLALVQIESADALHYVDSIAAIDGVDVLFVGPTRSLVVDWSRPDLGGSCLRRSMFSGGESCN